MKNLDSLALRYIDGQLLVLNQQKLPRTEEWIHCLSPEHMFHIIHSLQVRGAPLIGIAAALSFADYVKNKKTHAEIIKAANLLKSSRPTAVNLAHCIDRQLSVWESTDDCRAIIDVAETLFLEDAELCNRIAHYGFGLIEKNDTILTHCNTGKLVTTGIGTALGVMSYAHQHGKTLHVFVDETRPLLQGARLTTWELQRDHIPHTLICDNMAASLMRAGKINKIMVGADRIARNGDFANKIGTYSLAVLAHHHKIPFYVAAPYTTVDFNCENGDGIIIEERAADEVRGMHFGDQKVSWSPSECKVFNPSFDVTPAELVTGFILDKGVFRANEIGVRIKDSDLVVT